MMLPKYNLDAMSPEEIQGMAHLLAKLDAYVEWFESEDGPLAGDLMPMRNEDDSFMFEHLEGYGARLKEVTT